MNHILYAGFTAYTWRITWFINRRFFIYFHQDPDNNTYSIIGRLLSLLTERCASFWPYRRRVLSPVQAVQVPGGQHVHLDTVPVRRGARLPRGLRRGSAALHGRWVHWLPADSLFTLCCALTSSWNTAHLDVLWLEARGTGFSWNVVDSWRWDFGE